MGSVFTRFLNGRSGSSLSDSWVGGESFVVARAPGDSMSGVTLHRKNRTAARPETTGQLPPLPEIGRTESYYANLVHQADQQAQTHLREAAKVGQYITLGLETSLSWDDKLKYFRHALKRHCNPPLYPDDHVWMFYSQLADLVRQYCGHEALRFASSEDDMYAARVSMGQSRETIEDEAEQFFLNLMGSMDQRSEWFNSEDWSHLKLIRDQWI